MCSTCFASLHHCCINGIFNATSTAQSPSILLPPPLSLSLSLSPDAVRGGYFGDSNTTPLYTRSHCTGAETYYGECSRLSVNSCNYSNTDAGVVCGSSKGERQRQRERGRKEEENNYQIIIA